MEEKINKLVTDVEVIKNTLALFTKGLRCSEHESLMKDHEIRIRGLEDFKSEQKGKSFVSTVISSGIVGVIVGLLVKYL